MDGIYNGTQSSEAIRQARLTRHKLLRVNTANNVLVAWNDWDASGLASLDPNAILAGTVNPLSPRGIEGGPHYVMSAETSDNSHTYGLEFSIFIDGIPVGDGSVAAAGDFTVTIWELITVTQLPSGAVTPVWAALQPQTGVKERELYHTFDINATAIRFQISNLANAALSKSINIAIAEL